MSDPFLPVQGDEANRTDSPVQREDHDRADESEPDVFLGAAPADDVAGDDDGEPPVREGGVFRTPTGTRVDPADD